MKTATIFSVILLLFGVELVYSQSSFEKPKLSNADSWSIIVLPDVQNYSKFNRNQPILDLMMSWVEDHIDSLNVKMVVCVGDLVEQNDIINQGHDGDQSAQRQWEFISRMFARLDGKVPYIAATGNHDYSIDRQGKRSSRYSEFFTVDKNWRNRKVIVQNSTNENGVPTLENSAFELKDVNGKDYLFLTVEFAPRDTVLAWASQVVNLPQYKKHRVILTTHAFLSEKDKRTTAVPKWLMYEPYSVNNQIQKSPKIVLPKANSGEQIWSKLVEPASNIDLVLCGHISGEGYRVDQNSSGRAVHQMLFDAQSEGGGHRYGNGGDGWLRIIEFLPDNSTVKVKTYSPLFGISPTTQDHAWRRDVRNEFSFKLSK